MKERAILSESNQANYTAFWQEHCQLSFAGATKYLAHRDLPVILLEQLLHRHDKELFTILDYGCGNGETAQFVRDIFLEHGRKVRLHCVDLNQKNLEAAKQRLPEAQCSLLQRNHFPETIRDIDLVICNFVLLENTREEMQAILRDIQSVMAKNAVALITHNTAKVYDSENKWISFATDFPENKRNVIDPDSNKLTRKDMQPVAKQMLRAGTSGFVFRDYFYRRKTYLSAFADAELVVTASYKPLGLKSDNLLWRSERAVPPYRIDILRHQSPDQKQVNACDAGLYAQLFECIHDNTLLPRQIDAVAFDQSKRQKAMQLCRAIQAGDAESEMFLDPDCDIYALYLVKHQHLEFYQGMTVYYYIVMLMQFTNKQTLPKKDLPYRSERELLVHALSRDGQITDIGRIYLKHVADQLSNHTRTHCLDELIDYVLSLPLSEQWLFRLEMNADGKSIYESMYDKSGCALPYGKYYYDALMTFPLRYGIISFQFEAVDERCYIYHPSISIIRFCARKLSTPTLEPAFMFGTTGHAKLHDLHGRELHPVLLYSRFVTSNMLQAHGFNAGPVTTDHDLIHVILANVLDPEFRQLISQFLLPEFHAIIAKLDQLHKAEAIVVLRKIINELGDLDALGLVGMKTRDKRAAYIQRAFRSDNSCFQSERAFGERVYDVILFHMQLAFLAQKSWTCSQVNLWHLCKDSIIFHVNTNRSGTMLYVNHDDFGKSILHLADVFSRKQPLIEFKDDNTDYGIKWQAWLEMLAEEKDSQLLWDRVNRERSEELVLMINRFNLPFYHPHLPMTEEKREAFKSFIEAKIEIEARHRFKH